MCSIPTKDLRTHSACGRLSVRGITALLMSARRLSARRLTPKSGRPRKKLTAKSLWNVGILAVRFTIRARRLSRCAKLQLQEKQEISSKFYASDVILDIAAVQDFISQCGLGVAEEDLKTFLSWTLFREGTPITLRQILVLMTILKRKHLASILADTQIAFDALAENGRMPVASLQALIKQFNLKMTINEADYEDSTTGEALFSFADFSKLIGDAQGSQVMRKTSASFRAKLQKSVAEKLTLDNSAASSPMVTGLSKNDSPRDAIAASDFLSSGLPAAFTQDGGYPQRRPSACRREVFPLRVRTWGKYTFEEVAQRIEKFNSEQQPCKEKDNSRVRYCREGLPSAQAYFAASPAPAVATDQRPTVRASSAAYAAPRMEPDRPPPMNVKFERSHKSFASLDAKRKEMMRKIPHKSVNDFVGKSECLLRQEDRAAVLQKYYVAQAQRPASTDCGAPFMREMAQTALERLFPVRRSKDTSGLTDTATRFI